VLIDEPEISLHIDWQYKLIGAMVKQLPTKQLIVCTHSPVIATDYEDKMIEIKPNPTAVSLSAEEMDNIQTEDEIPF